MGQRLNKFRQIAFFLYETCDYEDCPGYSDHEISPFERSIFFCQLSVEGPVTC